MKFSSFLVLNAVVSLAFGVGLLLVPGTVLSLYGILPSSAVNLTGQFFGVELVGVGLLCWFARNVSDPAAVRAIILAFLINDMLGLIVSLMGTLSGVFNANGWSSVALYLLLAVGFVYFQFNKPNAS